MAGLVGRDHEIDAVVHRLLRRERSSVVVVEGEPGVGKSALLDVVLGRVAAAGSVVHRAAALEVERGRPYAAVSTALGCRLRVADPARRELAELVAGAADGSGGAFTIADRILDLLESEALVAPQVVAVDDLQWADGGTLAVLASLVRLPPEVAVSLVVATRPAPRREVAQVLEQLRRTGALDLRLAPLDGDAVACLVEGRTARRPSPRLQRLLARAAGNPLFVTSLLDALEQESALVDDGGQVDADELVPPSFRLVVLRRVATMPDAAIELLRQAAILGPAFTVGDLAATTTRPLGELLRDLEPARRDGLLTESGSRLRFTHDLVWDALYQDIPLGMRACLHLEAAERLAASGASPLEVGRHYANAPDAERPKGAAWMRAAAAQAFHRSPQDAAELLEAALELVGSRSDERADLLLDLAEALRTTGRLHDAETACREALRVVTTAADALRARLLLVRGLQAQERHHEAMTELDAADRAAPSPAHRRELQLQRARTLVSLTRVRQAAAMARGVLLDAEEHGDETVAVGALSVCMIGALGHGDIETALAFAQERLDRARRLPAPTAGPVVAEATFRLGMCLVKALRHREAVEVLDEARARYEALGIPRGLMGVHAHLGEVHQHRGSWDDAIAELEGLQVLADRMGVSAIFGRHLLAWIDWHRGEADPLGRLRPAEPGSLVETSTQWVSGLVRGDEDPHAGADTVARAWERSKSAGAADFRLLALDAVRLAVRAGRRELAREIADGIVPPGAPPRLAAYAVAASAMAGDDEDGIARASVMLADSEEEVARAVLDEHAAVLRARHTVDARVERLFRRSLEAYGQFGARADVARVSSAMRAAGIRTGARGTRFRPATGWEALTATEREVALLAARRLTNPEIGARLYISKRTVQSHLAHVFVKLGVSSRKQLADHVPASGSSSSRPAALAALPRDLA